MSAETKKMQMIVMDITGDTRTMFDIAEPVDYGRAEEQFRKLTGQGFLAATRPTDGSPGEKLRAFDPNAETIVFIPPLQGG